MLCSSLPVDSSMSRKRKGGCIRTPSRLPCARWFQQDLWELDMHDRDLIIEYREVEGKSKTDRCVGGAARKACASGGGFSTVGWHREVLFTQSCWSASETSLTKMNGVGIYYLTGTSKFRLRKSHSFGMFLIKKKSTKLFGPVYGPHSTCEEVVSGTIQQ
jgi:hypothetical protein